MEAMPKLFQMDAALFICILAKKNADLYERRVWETSCSMPPSDKAKKPRTPSSKPGEPNSSVTWLAKEAAEQPTS